MEIESLKYAIIDAIKNKRIEWQRHSLERMLERNISRSTAIEVVLNGEIIEKYSQDKPFPSLLYLGWINKRPIHVVVSYDFLNEKIFFITAYEPGLDHFEPGFKIRRKM